VHDYGALTYDKARHKASHNSYERDELPVVDQFPWNKRKTYDAGCRGLELDIQQSSANWAWSVSHVGGYSGDVDRQFSTYLELLASWSRMNRNHDVITVMVDIKAVALSNRDYPAYFDDYIARHFPVQKIFRPRDLLGPGEQLVDAARARGWPRLEDMRERFVFCLSGNEDRKRTYAATAPTQRLCFADVKGSTRGATTVKDRNRIVFNFKLSESYFAAGGHEDVPTGNRAQKIIKSIGKLRAHGGLIIRGYDLNTERSWKNARKLGVNMMSTDKVRKYSWAAVGKAPFVAV
jgi:hypothetical protein